MRPTPLIFALTALGIFTVAAVAWWLGGSESGLCRPESLFQLHAVWHAGAAAGLGAVVLANRVA